MAEAQVHTQAADAMQASMTMGNDPRFVLPSGAYDLQASLANDRREGGEDDPDDPLASVAAADQASAKTIRILAVSIVVGVVFLLGSLAQAVRSRRRALLIAGWVTLGISVALAIALELGA